MDFKELKLNESALKLVFILCTTFLVSIMLIIISILIASPQFIYKEGKAYKKSLFNIELIDCNNNN